MLVSAPEYPPPDVRAHVFAMVYLDYNATTPLLPEVYEAMQPYLLQHWGNASSPHAFADEPRRAIAEARGHVADLIGACPSEVVFTSGATESNQTILRSFLDQGMPVITSTVEHNSVLSVTQSPAFSRRCVAVPVSAGGLLDLAKFEQALTSAERPGLVSLIWVNNETGVVSPVEEAVALARQAGFAVHLDGAQAAGKMAVDVMDSGADYVSLSAHKIHGPKGVGALYVRDGLELRPLLHGTQEDNRRGGTEPVPLIVGFGAAARLAREQRPGREQAPARLRNALEQGILAAFPDAIINGISAPRVTNTSSITFPGIDADALVSLLSQRGVHVSNGSACKASSPTPSHVLLAMGSTYEAAGSTVRVSLSHMTTPSEIDDALAALSDAIPLLA